MLNFFEKNVVSPYENFSGWAETYLGKMVLNIYGINVDNLILNAMPPNAIFPSEVLVQHS